MPRDVGLHTREEMMRTNVASQEMTLESVQAMESWIKNGTVPIDYMLKMLGDPSKGVVVTPLVKFTTRFER